MAPIKIVEGSVILPPTSQEKDILFSYTEDGSGRFPRNVVGTRHNIQADRQTEETAT